MRSGRPTPPSSGKKRPRGLVALGSAAVVAVYGAGYLRTRAAAQQFDESPATRRPTPTPGSARGDGPAATDAASPTATLAMPTSPAGPRPAAPSSTVAASPTETAPAPSAPLKPSAAGPVTTTTPATIPTSTTGTSPASAPTSAGTSSAAAVTTPAAAATEPEHLASDATPAAAVQQAPVAPAVPARPVYKDGTYLGWGTSRHGDIQAQVVIEGGRIVSATIAQCLTRYSCSWISPLPPQVVTRQSPETDYVSGATQSTNAFYYAVVEALNKAK